MRLAQNNDVVHTLTPDRSDQPFGTAILPGRGWCGRLVPDAHGAQSARDDNAVNSIPISDHIARGHVPRKSLGYLTCNPLRRRVGCDVNPNESSAIKPYNHEAVEHSEANGRDNEQIHSGNLWRVVTQEGSPSLAWRPASLDHVLGDARLSDLKPQLEQFAVDARRTPKQILRAHLPDQRAQFRLDRLPALQQRWPKAWIRRSNCYRPCLSPRESGGERTSSLSSARCLHFIEGVREAGVRRGKHGVGCRCARHRAKKLRNRAVELAALWDRTFEDNN
jgi:hypothetical protein